VKIVIFLIMPLLIAALWKYNSIACETLRQIKLGKKSEIDPMQSAVLPEIIIFIILSLVTYLIVNIFLPENSVNCIFIGQLTLLILLTLFAVKYTFNSQ